MNSVASILGEAIKGVQAALLAVAVVVILCQPARTPALHACLSVLLFTECAWIVYRTWRRGLLTRTAEQLSSDLQAKGRITSGPFEQVCIVAGMAAAVVFAL